MMAFHFITFYLQYLHYVLSFMKVCDQGLYIYTLSQQDPVLLHDYPPSSNKQTKTLSFVG